MMAVPFPHGWNPQGMADLFWWLDVYSNLIKDGSNLVSDWDTKVPGGTGDMTGVGADRPLWLNNGLNGLPTVEFTGEKMAGAFTPAHTDAAAVFCVGTIKNAGSSAGRMIAMTLSGGADGSTSGGWRPLQRASTTSNLTSFYCNAGLTGTRTAQYDVPFIYVAIADPVADEFAGVVDGGSINYTAMAGAVSNFNVVVLGAGITSGAPNTTVMHGCLSEVVMLRVRPGVNLHRLVEGYLAWRWNTQASLSGTHPWRQRAP